MFKNLKKLGDKRISTKVGCLYPIGFLFFISCIQTIVSNPDVQTEIPTQSVSPSPPPVVEQPQVVQPKANVTQPVTPTSPSPVAQKPQVVTPQPKQPKKIDMWQVITVKGIMKCERIYRENTDWYMGYLETADGSKYSLNGVGALWGILPSIDEIDNENLLNSDPDTYRKSMIALQNESDRVCRRKYSLDF